MARSRWLGVCAALALLASAAGAAAAGAAPRIVGGGPASQPYPFAAFVELHYPNSGEIGYCGGALVAARFVVTAGHCLEGSPTRVDVAVGVSHVDHTHTMSSGASTIPAANQYLDVRRERDPAFAFSPDQTPVDDVAVLTLPRPAPQVQVRLPRPSDAAAWAPGSAAVAIGWGRCGVLELCRDGTTDLPADLREVSQPIVADAGCAGYSYSAASMLCAGGEAGKDTCNGDSGGPLLVGDGTGGLLLAGATSFGSSDCGDGTPAVYTRLGGSDVNAWLRARIPQVEIEADATAPAPGQVVTFTATPRDPVASGRFGGYDAIAWDLEGDGTFTDAPGRTSVDKAMAEGTNTIAVRATSAAGDAETRVIRLRTVNRVAVSFAEPTVTVKEGDVVTLTITRTGPGAGTVTATPTSASARELAGGGAPQTVAFGPADQSRTVAFRVRDDRAHERDERFRVVLGDYTGDMQPGSLTVATVIVLDNDAAVSVRSSGAVRRGRLAVRLRADRPGSFRVRAAGVRNSSLRLGTAGAHTVRLAVGSGIARRLAAGRAVRLRLTITFRPADGDPPVTVHRRVALRPAT